MFTAAREYGDRVELEVTLKTCCQGDEPLSWLYEFVAVPRVNNPYVFVEREALEPCAA